MLQVIPVHSRWIHYRFFLWYMLRKKRHFAIWTRTMILTLLPNKGIYTYFTTNSRCWNSLKPIYISWSILNKSIHSHKVEKQVTAYWKGNKWKLQARLRHEAFSQVRYDLFNIREVKLHTKIMHHSISGINLLFPHNCNPCRRIEVLINTLIEWFKSRIW